MDVGVSWWVTVTDSHPMEAVPLEGSLVSTLPLPVMLHYSPLLQKRLGSQLLHWLGWLSVGSKQWAHQCDLGRVFQVLETQSLVDKIGLDRRHNPTSDC